MLHENPFFDISRTTYKYLIVRRNTYIEKAKYNKSLNNFEFKLCEC